MIVTPDRLHPVEAYSSMFEGVLQLPYSEKADRLHHAAGHRERSVYAESHFDVQHILADPARALELADKLDHDLSAEVGSGFISDTGLIVLTDYYGLETGIPLSIADIANRTQLSRQHLQTQRSRSIYGVELYLARQFLPGQNYSPLSDRLTLSREVRRVLFA